MRIDLVSIFPSYFDVLQLSLVGKAIRDGLLDLQAHDLRSWTTDRHRTVDDTPFGGGAGMVMRPDVWGSALDELLTDGCVLLVPSPAGRTLNHELAAELATKDHLVVACGRYEGIDSRIVDHYTSGHQVIEFSLGDYVVNGGEVAALALVEAVGRLVPGVVGNPQSLIEESHASGLLEYPVYTKPVSWREHDVPEVLLSGHHGQIARWRRDQTLLRTANRRPDLLLALDLTQLDRHDLALLDDIGWRVSAGKLQPPEPTAPQA